MGHTLKTSPGFVIPGALRTCSGDESLDLPGITLLTGSAWNCPAHRGWRNRQEFLQLPNSLPFCAQQHSQGRASVETEALGRSAAYPSLQSQD